MELPFIATIKYQKEIDLSCAPLKSLCGLDYFIIYLHFKNNQLFILSNAYSHLNDYYQKEMYKHDFSISPACFENSSYYLCDHDKGISETYSHLLRNKHKIHRVFYKIYPTPEFDIILGGANSLPVTDKLGFYKKTHKDFDHFALKFIEENCNIFKAHNPELANSIYFNNFSVLKKLFNNPGESHILSDRENECLVFTAKGFTTEEISHLLMISKYTVEEYKKSILKKFNAVNMANAIFLAMKQGYFDDYRIILPNVNSFFDFRNLKI